MRNNFRNETTGEEFAIGKYSMSFKGGETIYKSEGKQIVDPNTGEVLVPIKREGPLGIGMIGGTRAERRDKDVAHFKSVAKKHGKSEETKQMKRDAMAREMKVMGYEKK